MLLTFTLSNVSALTVSPARADVVANPGETIKGEFTLINTDAKDEIYYTSVENFDIQGTSSTSNFTTSKVGFPSWLKIAGKVTIKKDERIKVPYSIIVPKDATGGHFGAIFLSSVNPQSSSSQNSVGAKVGMLIMLKVASPTSSSSCITLTKALAKGQQDSEVSVLQQFLVDGGYMTAKPDGYFRASTVTALKKFQIANGLSPVGSVGAGTRGKVKEVSCKMIEVKKTTTQVDVVAPKPVATSSPLKDLKEKVNVVNGFTETIGAYDNFYNLIGIGGKLAYIASKNTATSTSKRVVVYDGKEISIQYDSAGDLIKVGNKFAYLATKKNIGSIAVYDGSEILPAQCTNISHLGNINNKLAFNCDKRDGSAAMFLDGVEVSQSKRYKIFPQTSPLDVGGKLAYEVADSEDYSGSKTTLLIDGLSVDYKNYPYISQVYSVNNKLLFAVRTADNLGNHLAYDGKDFANGYDAVESFAQVGDKTIVIGLKAIGNIYTMFVNGVVQNTGYDKVVGVTEIRGKLAYFAEKGGKSFIVFDGKEFGKEYDQVGQLFNVNNKLVFIAK